MNSKWLTWAQEIQSIAQSGIEYSKDKYDIERFKRLRELSVEIVSDYTNQDMKKITELFANESGYQTPKVDIRAVIYKDDKILFVKEDDELWSLPGGWADINLSVSENVKKEAFEEAGVQINPEQIIAVLDRGKYTNKEFPYSVYKIFIKCRYLSGSFIKNIETSNADFFYRKDLPELSETRNTREQIYMCFDFIKDNCIKTIFD